MNPTIVSKKQLTQESKYAYCPYCYAQFKDRITPSRAMADMLPKLYVVVTQELILKEDNETMKYFDKHWLCEKCDRKLTEKDFYKFYVAKADGTPYFSKKED